MKCVPETCYDILKDDDLGYRSITCLDLLDHPFGEQDGKTTKMRAKALADMITDTDITGTSLSKLWVRNKQLQKFIIDTQEEVTDGVYISNCVKVIENTFF